MKIFNEKIGVSPIDKKMRENRLKWFDHVQMKEINAPMQKSDLIQEGMKMDQGKPKKTLVEVEKRDMLTKEVMEMILNKRECYRRIHMAHPN